jgi:hypothetical protein
MALDADCRGLLPFKFNRKRARASPTTNISRTAIS